MLDKRWAVRFLSIVIASGIFATAFFSDFAKAEANDETVCVVYFTAIGCSNCRVTDPIVLDEWPKKYDNLVVVEYMFYDWGEDNARLLGTYAQNYGSWTSVPQLFITSDEIALGRIEVPNAEDEIKNLQSNNCLIDGFISFNELGLNSIDGEPLKIWSNGKLLTRVKKSETVSSDFLKELLFSDDLESTIEGSVYDIETTEAEPAPISDGQIDFSNAIKIEDSWILSYNEESPTTTTSPSPTQTTSPTVSTTTSTTFPEENADTIEITIFGINFGTIDISKVSLPALTIIIGLLDGFNPCAMFILCFLLVFLIGTKSRKKVFIIGGIFLFISGFVYFLFITAWFNFFVIFRYVPLLKLIVGALVIVAGLINIKDYFYFQKGISLTLPKSWKPKVVDKMKMIAEQQSLVAMILSVVTVAFVVNVVELMCTIGFPMIYTQILATYNLPQTAYYLYILIYCTMYMIDDFLLFTIAVTTLHCVEMTKKRVRIMKLISGVLMILLAIWFVLS